MEIRSKGPSALPVMQDGCAERPGGVEGGASVLCQRRGNLALLGGLGLSAPFSALNKRLQGRVMFGKHRSLIRDQPFETCPNHPPSSKGPLCVGTHAVACHERRGSPEGLSSPTGAPFRGAATDPDLPSGPSASLPCPALPWGCPFSMDKVQSILCAGNLACNIPLPPPASLCPSRGQGPPLWCLSTRPWHPWCPL